MKASTAQHRKKWQQLVARSSIKEILHELKISYVSPVLRLSSSVSSRRVVVAGACHVCVCLCVLYAMTGDANRFSGAKEMEHTVRG